MNQLTTYSVEFFPPKTEAGKLKLMETVAAFAGYKPSFFSVTYGAGGSTRDLTLDTIKAIQQAVSIEAAPHLSCIGATRDSLREILAAYQSIGVKRIVALRGDLPSGMRELGELPYASDLVSFIRAESGDYFTLEVAAYPEVHPQASDWQSDILNFRKKVDAGASSAITQYFYNVDAYFRFLEDCLAAGINIPIVPGIMPITNARQLIRFSDACGTDIPRWIRKRLMHYDDDLPAIRAFGLDVVSDLCQKLIDNGVENLHFYAMNQSEPTIGLWQNLGLHPSA